jgi:hypothetical protein
MTPDINNEEDITIGQNEILANLPEEEKEAFLEEVGTLIFRSTVMRYLSTLSPEDSLQFEVFIKVNAEKEDFIDLISAQYPEFKILLDEEMEAFNNEL